MKASRIILCVLDAAVAVLALIFGALVIRKYFEAYPSDMMMWLYVTAWVAFMFSALFVLALLIAGIVLAVRSATLRRTTIAMTVALGFFWLSVPASPYVADYFYQRTGFQRINPITINGFLNDFGWRLTYIATENGDTLACDDIWTYKGSLKTAAAQITDEDGFVTDLTFIFYMNYRRMEVRAEAEFTAEADGEYDLGKLSDALEYYNAIAEYSFTADMCRETMTEESYAEYAHDGYSGQLRRASKFTYIRVNRTKVSNAEGEYKKVAFTLNGLVSTQRKD